MYRFMTNNEKMPASALLLFVSISLTLIPINVIPFLRGAWGMIIIIPVCWLILRFSPKSHGYVQFAQTIIKSNKNIFLLYIYFCVGAVFGYVRGGSDWKIFIQYALGGYALLLNPYLTKNRTAEVMVSRTVVVLLTMYSVFSLNVIQDETARDLFTETQRFTEHGIGVGTSAAFQTLSMGVLLAISLFFSERNVLLKGCAAVCALIISMMVFRSGFTTPLGLLLIGLCFFGWLCIRYPLHGKGSRLFKRFALFVAAMIIFLGVYKTYSFLVTTDDSRFNAVSWRIKNFVADPLTGGYQSREESRFWKAEYSFRSFLKNPIFGGGGSLRDSSAIGGHCSILDYLALLGLFGGGGAYLVLMCKLFGNNYKNFKQRLTFQSATRLSVFVMIFVGGFLNPYWYGPPMLFAFLFCYNFKYPNNAISQPDRNTYVPMSEGKWL